MQNNKPQLWFIGGGEVHASREEFLSRLESYPYEVGGKYYDWKSWIAGWLADTVEVIKPDFPNKQSADYDAWKIWFEKYIEKYVTPRIQINIIAHSLGGIFIAKYLSKNTFPVKIQALHMVATVFNDDWLDWEIVGNFALDPENLGNLRKQVEHLHLWHSKDDPIVPFSHSENFQKYLPNSTLHSFDNRGHFANQAHFVELFLELIP